MEEIRNDVGGYHDEYLELADDESEEPSFEEVPFSFEKPVMELEEEQEFMVNGMFVQRRELVINYEDGRGVVVINIYTKNGYVHSMEGVNARMKTEWEVRFFLPGEFRK